MKDVSLSSRRRLAVVLDYSGERSLFALGHTLGLERVEVLLRIWRGQRLIDEGVARAIHTRYPVFPLLWLLEGRSE